MERVTAGEALPPDTASGASPPDAGARLAVASSKTEHDIFISYSRRDVEFARALDRALRSYHPPRRSGLRPGYLRVFRDQSDMTGVEYGESIRRHLDASASVILICTPNARASRRVAEEIECFAASHGWSRVVPILYIGSPTSEATVESESLPAFPEGLMREGREPLAVDYRDFAAGRDKIDGGRYFGPWCGLLSNLYGVSRAVIEQRENRRRLVRLRTIGTTAAALVALLSVALLITLRSRAEAGTQRDRALASIGRILDQRAWQALDARDRHLAAQYALAGWKVAPSTEAEQRVVLASIVQGAGESRVVAEDGTKGLGVAISLSGNLFATTGEHGNVRLWEMPSGRQVGIYRGHQLSTTQALFTPDGLTGLSSSDDGTIRVWRVRDQQELDPFIEPGQEVKRMALSPDGRYVIASSEPKDGLTPDGYPTLSLWRIAGAQRIWVDTVPEPILALSFLGDGKAIAVLDETGRLEMRHWHTGVPYRVQLLPGVGLTAAAIAPAQDLMVTGAADGTVQIFRLQAAALLSSRKGHDGRVRSVAVSRSGRSVASGGNDGTARLWSVDGGHGLGLLLGHRGAITSISYGPGDVILTAGSDSSIRIWSNRRLIQLHVRGATKAALTADGSTLAIAAGDTLSVYQLPASEGAMPMAFPWPARVDLTATRVNDTIRVTSIAQDGRVFTGSLPGPPPLIRRELGGLFAAAVSPDGSAVAISSFESPTRVSVVDLASGARIVLSGTAESPVDRIRFSRDGARIVAASQEGWIRIWNVRDHSVVKTFEEARPMSGLAMFSVYGGKLRDVALNRDGTYLTYLERDGTAHVFDLRADRPLPLLGPSAVVPLEIAISDDARLVAVAGLFGSEIWDAKSGHSVARFDKPTGQLMFDFDGHYLIAGAAQFVGDNVPSARENPLVTEIWDIGNLYATMSQLSESICTHFLTTRLHWFSERAIAADPLIEEVIPAQEDTPRTVCPASTRDRAEGLRK